MSKKKKKHTRLRIVIIFILLTVLAVALAYAYEEYNKTGMERIFEKVEGKANLTEYTVYGTHLNLKRRNRRKFSKNNIFKFSNGRD